MLEKLEQGFKENYALLKELFEMFWYNTEYCKEC